MKTNVVCFFFKLNKNLFICKIFYFSVQCASQDLFFQVSNFIQNVITASHL